MKDHDFVPCPDHGMDCCAICRAVAEEHDYIASFDGRIRIADMTPAERKIWGIWLPGDDD